MPDKYKELFISEAEEMLGALNKALVELEKRPGDTELLHEVFRYAHTIKATAASEGETDISDLAHGVEDILSALREERINIKPELMDLLFSSCDILESLLEKIKKKKKGKVDIGPSLSKLRAYLEKAQPQDVEREGLEQEMIGPGKAEEIQSIRINVGKLDRLMNLVGELVVEKSKLSDLLKDSASLNEKEAVANIERLIWQLQDLAIETRLVPLAVVFERFPRMVRDIAKQEGKEVEFSMTGTGIELDRSILYGITDPLVHLLRNALTHGIETPPERKRAGKPVKGTVNLSARREKNKVILEATDDGKGINLNQVQRLAREMGILSEEDLQKLSEEQLLFLITYPGLTTQSEAKGISGRGVGMDVVRRTVESFGGRLNIVSKVGEGSAFTVELPLSLAIIQALLVGADSQRFAIPLINILETIRLERRKIKLMEKQEIFNLRGEVLPIFHLDELLDTTFSYRNKKEEELLCIMEVGFQKAGIAVDAFLGQQDMVVKPIPKIFGQIKGLSGLAMLRDGYPCAVLDVPGLM
jgi:two-component system chemotaxis sensor kinase CheA